MRTKYILIACAAYLLLGFFLHRQLMKGTTYRPRFRDILVGSAFMPIAFLALIVFSLCEEAWKRLLIALDFNPPEEMRAGPLAPAEDDPNLILPDFSQPPPGEKRQD